MRTLPPKTTLIVIAAITSLLAQGFAFAPPTFEFPFQGLPPWANRTFGVLLFSLTLISLALLVRWHPYRSRPNWILLAIQAVSVFGVFLLQDAFAARASWAVFLFSGAITTLTILGILANRAPAPIEAASLKPIESLETTGSREPYLEPNARVLR